MACGSGGGGERMGPTDAADVAWMAERLGDQPLATFKQSVQLPVDYRGTLSHTFIQFTDAPFFAEAGTRAKKLGFRYRDMLSIPAGHAAMISQPTALSTMLLEGLPISTTK